MGGGSPEMKLQTKLLILYAISTMFILLALGGILYWNLWNRSIRSIQADISNELQYIDFALITFFEQIETGINVLATNNTVRVSDDRHFTTFLDADEKTFTYHIGESEQKIIDIFRNYLLTHPYVNSVYMGRENGSFVRSHHRERPTRYDPRERPWYRLAKENPWRVMKTDAYQSVTTSDVNIGNVRALNDERGVFYGVVGIDVTLATLTNYISNFKTTSLGKVLLVDRNGLILAGFKKDMLFQNLQTYSPALLNILTKSVQGFPFVTIEGTRYGVCFINTTEQDWKIATLIPASHIKRQIFDQIVMTEVWLLVGLTLLSILSLVGLRVYVMRPLIQFTNETGYIAQTSNLDRHININSQDEIGLLAHSYNEMMDALNITYQSLKDTQADLVTHRDHLEDLITERTSLLEAANENLSAEIEERIQALNELVIAKEKAEVADRLKSAFLATMSHELRTPLNSIIGFTGIILQEIVGPLNDEQKKQLNMVRGSSQHLLSLINDVLDISKIEAGQLQVASENYDLRQTIEKAVESARPLAGKKGLELTSAISSEIETTTGDRRRVEQILLNLISNAIKFTEKGSVKIECEPEEDYVTIRVIDTGIGIKNEDMETVFQAFQQIDSGMTRKYEGTGLGLSICKKLVELMGGKIWVISVLGSGSTFAFSLPKQRKEI